LATDRNRGPTKAEPGGGCLCAFLCWILEHVPDPARILSELRRACVKTFHLDNRSPGERAEFLRYWTELLLSGVPELLKAKKVSAEVVAGMKEELDQVGRDPNSVFFYSFIQARARA
jgi:hypothetical protein